MRQPRPDRTDRPRFTEVFARRPSRPRIARWPDSRAWSTTVVVALLVGGTALAVPLAGRISSGRSYAADQPVAFHTAAGTPSPGSPGTRGRPSSSQNVVRPGVTITGPGTTVTAPPPPGERREETTGLPTDSTTTAPPPAVPGRSQGTTAPVVPPTQTATTAGRTTPTQPTTSATTNAPRKVQDPKAMSVAPLQNYGSNRCIDIKDAQSGVAAVNTPLQLWDCAKSSNQTWSFFSDGTIRSLGLCMDLAGASTNDGAAIQVTSCNGSWAQHFTLNTAHDLVNPTADKCVTATSTANGTRLTLHSCNGTSTQKWHQP